MKLHTIDYPLKVELKDLLLLRSKRLETLILCRLTWKTLSWQNLLKHRFQNSCVVDIKMLLQSLRFAQIASLPAKYGKDGFCN